MDSDSAEAWRKGICKLGHKANNSETIFLTEREEPFEQDLSVGKGRVASEEGGAEDFLIDVYMFI